MWGFHERVLSSITVIKCPKITSQSANQGVTKPYFLSIDDLSLVSKLLSRTNQALLMFLQIESFREDLFSQEQTEIFTNLSSLRWLAFLHCNIRSLPANLSSLTTLEKLRIYNCKNLSSLPDLPPSLQSFHTQACNSAFKEHCRRKTAHIPNKGNLYGVKKHLCNTL